MDRPVFISFIIAVYNRPAVIRHCLDSILMQHDDDYEIVIADDCSTDNTMEVLLQYQSRAPDRIKIVQCLQNAGANSARNRAVEKSTGQYLYFIDSDDRLPDASTLVRIRRAVDAHKDFVQFLFRVQDREADATVLTEETVVYYKDWLSEKVAGDYVSILRRDYFIFFDEQLRIFETLSWNRILRHTQRQLYFPVTVMERERGREDSISHEYMLKDTRSITNYYTYLYLLCQWYYEDYKSYQLQYKLFHHIRRAIWMGIAIGEYGKNKYFISLLQANKQPVMKYRWLNNGIFRKLAYKRIINH